MALIKDSKANLLVIVSKWNQPTKGVVMALQSSKAADNQSVWAGRLTQTVPNSDKPIEVGKRYLTPRTIGWASR